ncbi:hypothetical protein F4X33_04365, partial [Candidatus Poribacteria bacterium]|nr:hypothetical protein [Candidatus Poribacteria bacterium]
MKCLFSRFPVFPFSRFLILSVVTALLIPHASAQVVDIPDPNLERAIRERLELPTDVPITQQEMLRLSSFRSQEGRIENLTGIEYAHNIDFLHIAHNPIQDLSPIFNLTRLKSLALSGIPIEDPTFLKNFTELDSLYIGDCGITDITVFQHLTKLTFLWANYNLIVDISPLANLTQLETLRLNHNRIVDVSPLANLTRLKELRIENNQIYDFSSLQGLSLTHFTYDEVCELPDPPILDRIANRSLPSIVQTWSDRAVNLSHLESEDRFAYHDLYWTYIPFGLGFLPAPQGDQVVGVLETAITERDMLLAKNPNMIFLAELRMEFALMPGHYPEDWFGWLRDENGNLIGIGPHSLFEDHEDHDDLHDSTYLVNFELPEVQDLLVQQAISVSRCGLYDGIYFDAGTEQAAKLSIVQRIRANVPDDFLIVCNRNENKLPLSAPYMNGNFMETHPKDPAIGYTREDIIVIETNLIWLEQNLREPQINCPRGHGIATEPPDSPNNRRWMRLFTTMSLTLSDGYALYTTGHFYNEHFWYDFWDADLGQPIGPIAQRYQEDIEGLYIREFTNGWAVYNRSGVVQTISLPAPATPVSDRGTNAAAQTHLLPDLDGEMYLKAPNPADVNGDGQVNVLDLVHVANNFGKADPDLNGDGVVNILDLTLVAKHLSQ